MVNTLKISNSTEWNSQLNIAPSQNLYQDNEFKIKTDEKISVFVLFVPLGTFNDGLYKPPCAFKLMKYRPLPQNKWNKTLSEAIKPDNE